MEGIKVSIPAVSTFPQVKVSSTPKPAGTSTTTNHPAPLKNTEGMAVKVYRKLKKRVQFYTLKQQLFGNLSKGDQFLLAKSQSRLIKARKIAAPELIQQLLKKRASRGKGKKRGSDLQKLMSKNISKPITKPASVAFK